MVQNAWQFVNKQEITLKPQKCCFTKNVNKFPLQLKRVIKQSSLFDHVRKREKWSMWWQPERSAEVGTKEDSGRRLLKAFWHGVNGCQHISWCMLPEIVGCGVDPLCQSASHLIVMWSANSTHQCVCIHPCHDKQRCRNYWPCPSVHQLFTFFQSSKYVPHFLVSFDQQWRLFLSKTAF